MGQTGLFAGTGKVRVVDTGVQVTLVDAVTLVDRSFE
jgi:hypothetical protein